ncbi:MAG: hypothetical protein M3P44_04065 [Actinomycetota bacterium]|nr:hypothetical protein [Actinomycetota bacterium]
MASRPVCWSSAASAFSPAARTASSSPPWGVTRASRSPPASRRVNPTYSRTRRAKPLSTALTATSDIRETTMAAISASVCPRVERSSASRLSRASSYCVPA